MTKTYPYLEVVCMYIYIYIYFIYNCKIKKTYFIQTRKQMTKTYTYLEVVCMYIYIYIYIYIFYISLQN